jgi:ABC-type uncharacterized transport system ATPase subunit
MPAQAPERHGSATKDYLSWVLDWVDDVGAAASAAPGMVLRITAATKEAFQMNIQTIGLDLAKSIFQVHGVDENGQTVLVKKLH